MKPISKFSISMLVFPLLMLFTASAANCGDGVGACSCGDSMTASYTMVGDLDGSAVAANCLTFGANDIELDCNGYTIKGNSPYHGIYTNFHDRINITNCNINNSNYAISMRGTDGGLISNVNLTNNTFGIRGVGNFNNDIIIQNILLNNSNTNIYAERFNRTIIRNFTIYSASNSGIDLPISENVSIYDGKIVSTQNAAESGISTQTNGYGNFNITRVNVTGFLYGIRNREPNDNTIISDCIVSGVGLWGITVAANNDKALNNHIYNDSWNAIFYAGNHTVIDGNYIDNFLHHGIDTHGDGTHANHTNITNNYITQTSLTWQGGDAGIYIVNASNTFAFNNTLINLINTTQYLAQWNDGGRGITIEGGYTEDNKIVNNTFINISGYCLRVGDKNGIYEDNTFDNCGYNSDYHGDIVIRKLSGTPLIIVDSIFINNSRTDGLNVDVWGIDSNATPTFQDMKVTYDYNSQYTLDNGEVNFSCTISSTSQNYTTVKGQSWSLSECVGGGVFPYDDFNLTNSATFNKGTYYIMDDGLDGVITPLYDFKTLDGHGSTIYTNRTGIKFGHSGYFPNDVNISNIVFKYYNTSSITSRGGWVNGRTNIAFYNNTFDNFTRGLELNSLNGIAINNSFLNNYEGLRVSVRNNQKVIGNYVNNSEYVGIYLYLGINQTVHNNSVYASYFGILLGGVNDSSIYKNYIYNSSKSCIETTDANGATVSNIWHNNTCVESSNCFDSNSNNQTVIDNICSQYRHGAFDCNTRGCSNCTFQNNILTTTVSDGGGSIFIYNASGHNIINNYVSTNGIGIQESPDVIGTGTFTKNNYFTKNTIISTASSCLSTGSLNSTYSDNIFTCNTSGNGFTLQNTHGNITLTNNTNTENWFKIQSRVNAIDRVIITNSSSNTLIFEDFLNNIAFNWLSPSSTYKYLQIENTTVKATLSGNNSVRNSTVALCQQDVTGVYTETIGAGGRTFVVEHQSSSYPKMTSIALTVTDIEYDYSVSAKRPTYTCSGTGNTAFTNFNLIIGTSGFYVHYIDGVESDAANTNDYTLTSCSTHTWSGVTNIPLSISSPTSRTILRQVLAVFVALAGIAITLVFSTKWSELTFEQWILYAMIVVVALALIGAMLQVIFNV